MKHFDLNISVLSTGISALRGTVADENSPNVWIRAGADVDITLNPPGTSYSDSAVLGGGRIYDDRIEIDLILDEPAAASLMCALKTSEAPQLRLSTRATTPTVFRVEAVADLS